MDENKLSLLRNIQKGEYGEEGEVYLNYLIDTQALFPGRAQEWTISKNAPII